MAVITQEEADKAAGKYLQLTLDTEDAYSIPRGQLVRQIYAESRFNPNAVSPAGAIGIAQIMPKMHPGVDPTDPVASIKYAGQHMAQLKQQLGTWPNAVAGYNAGAGAVIKAGGIPNFPETQNYEHSIMGGPPSAAPGAPGASGVMGTGIPAVSPSKPRRLTFDSGVDVGELSYDGSQLSAGAPTAASGPSRLGAAVRGGVGSAGPVAAGIAAFPYGAAAGAAVGGPLAPVTGLIGGLGAAAGAGYIVSKGQDLLLEAMPGVAKVLGQAPEQQAADEAAHPYYRFAGQLAPNLVGFPANLKGLTSVAGLAGRGVNAAISGATELGQQLAGDEPVDLAKVSMAAGVAALHGNAPRPALPPEGVPRLGYDGAAAAPVSAAPAAQRLLGYDGAQDTGVHGGAGNPSSTSTDAGAYNRPPLSPPESGQMALPFGPSEAPEQLPLELSGGAGQAPPSQAAAPEQGQLDLAHTQGNLNLPAPPTRPPGQLDLRGGAGGTPSPSASLGDIQPPPTAIRGNPPLPVPAGQPLPPAPGNPRQLGSQADLTGSPLPNQPPPFSTAEIVKQLRDAAGTPEKPATPDGYMFKLANQLAQSFDPKDPEGAAAAAHLSAQMDATVQVSDHLLDQINAIRAKPQPMEAAQAQEKPLLQAQSQVAKTLKTLTAAQDIMPDLVAEFRSRIGLAKPVEAAQATQAALKDAQGRLASGLTGGTRSGEPEASTMTAADMIGKNVRAKMLNQVLDDPHTVDPFKDFRGVLAHIGVKDVALSPAEQAEIGAWHELHQDQNLPSSPNEMRPELVNEARAAGPAGVAPSLNPSKFKLSRAPVDQTPPAPEVTHPLEPAPRAQGKLFTARGKPTAAAAARPAIDNQLIGLGESQPALRPEPATKAEPARDVSSRVAMVKEANRRKLLDTGTTFKLLEELKKPQANLDMVDATVAKAVKRGEAIAKVKGPESNEQAQIDAYMARRAHEDPLGAARPRAAPPEAVPAAPFEGTEEIGHMLESSDRGDVLPGQGEQRPPLERRGESTSGMSKEDVQQVVNEHTLGWKGAPKIEVHQEHPTGGNAAGLYDPATKTVHLYADNIANPSEAKATVFHESLGHYGLDKTYGPRLDKMLGDIYKTNPTMRSLGDDWLRAAGDRYSALAPDRMQAHAINEVLAQMGEGGAISDKGGVRAAFNRVAGYVRDTARRMGMKLGYTDNDVAQVLRRGQESVTQGAPGGGGSSGAVGYPPLERNAGPIGHTLAEKAHAMLNPETLKTNSEDIWDNIKGSARRGFMKWQDVNWLSEAHEKLFIKDGVPLLRNQKEIANLQEASKQTDIQTASGPHKLFMDLPLNQQKIVRTLLNDGRKGSVSLEIPGSKEPELRARYQALDPAARQSFDAVRKHYDAEHTQTVGLLKSWIDNTYADALNDKTQSPEALKAVEKEVAGFKKEIDAKYKKTPGYVPYGRFGDFTVVGESKAWRDAVGEHAALKANLGKLENPTAEQSQALTDSQKALDKLEDSDRSVVSFEKEADMKRHAAELRAQGWNAREKLKGTFDAKTDAVSSGFMRAILDHMTLKAEQDPDLAEGINGLKKMINQLYLTHLPENSAMKRQISAKGTAGYSEDFSRVYAQSTQQHAGFFNAAKYGMQARDNLEQMHQHALAQPGIRAQEVYNQFKAQFNANEKYSSTKINSLVNQMSYAYYLGASPGFGFMHMMQTPLVTWPMLAAHFGYMKASGALASASKQVLGNYFGKFYHPGSEHLVGETPQEQLAIKMAVQHNLISSTETAQFANAAMGAPGMMSKMGRNIMGVASYMPHHIERANRLLTFKAAYGLAAKDADIIKGVNDPASEHFISNEDHANFLKTHPDLATKSAVAATADQAAQPAQEGLSKLGLAAARLAEKITADSHVDYGRANSSEMLNAIKAKPVLGWAAQFQTYQFGMLKLLGQNADRMFDKSLSPAERSVARRTLAGVLGSHALMTGAMGLPGAGLAMLGANVYHKFLGNEDEPFDAETSFRNTLATALGKDAGSVAARGLLYAPGVRDVVPADVTDRLGMGDLGNFFNQSRVSDKINSETFLGYLGSQITGPAGAMFGNLANGYQFAHEGNLERAAEQFAPKVLKDAMKFTRYMNAGVSTGTDMPVVKPEELTGFDLAAQLLGFTPQKVTEAYSQRSAVTEAKAQLQDRRGVLIKEYTRAMLGGDAQALTAIRAQVQTFNQAQVAAGLVTQRLNYSQLNKSVMEHRMAARRLQGGVSIAPRERALRNEFGSYAPDTTE